MKRKRFLATLLLAAGLFASCDVDEFKDILSHPIDLEGEINPQWGLPAANGELNFYDIINNLGGNITGYLDTGEVLCIVYTMETQEDSLPHNNKKHFLSGFKGTPLPGPKSDDNWLEKDTTLQLNNIAIDFFKNATFEEMDFKIRHLWMHFNVGVTVHAENATIARYMSARVDSLKLSYIDKNGGSHDFNDLDNLVIDIDSIYASNAVEKDVTLDLAPIINDKPVSVSGSFKLHFRVSPDILNDHTLDDVAFENLLDSINEWNQQLQLTKMFYRVSGDISFPLELQINKLNYSFPVERNTTSNGLNLDSLLAQINDSLHGDLDSSYIMLYLENGLPLNLRLAAAMVNGNDIDTLLYSRYGDIDAAFTIPTEDPLVERAIRATTDTVKISLNGDLLDKFSKAKTLNIDAKLRTDVPNDHFVQLRKSDFLRVHVVFVASAKVRAQFPLLENGLLKF